MMKIKPFMLWTSKISIMLFVFCLLLPCEPVQAAKTSPVISVKKTVKKVKGGKRSKRKRSIKRKKRARSQEIVSIKSGVIYAANQPKKVQPASSISSGLDQQEVQRFARQYNYSRKSISSLKRKPHFNYVVAQLDSRNMPRELAMLPMLESNYQPHAVSNRGAAGIWQFMPSTGRQFGLSHQGRRDVPASTKAALNYLQYLHGRFNHDWMLALAAYNAGEGTIERAIQRNRRAGKPTHFWALNVPKQTRQYVPKFLALVKVMKEV